MKIGSKLRYLRNKNRYSQTHVAQELSMTQSNYSKLESDKFFPSCDVLERISKFYQIPMEELLLSSIVTETDNPNGTSNLNALPLPNQALIINQLDSSKDAIIRL